MNSKIKKIKGGVLAPKGFVAAGIHCGIKEKSKKRDLAMIVSEVKAVAAGVFTTNAVKAASVIESQKNIKSGYAQAIIVNSGNANACNGKQGFIDARKMMSLTEKYVGVPAKLVLNASTGVIGHVLPMKRVEAGIKEVASRLHEDYGDDVAHAIMTTDTFKKEIAVKFEVGGVPVCIGATAKGSGMIEPNMATMLAFITSDVAVAPPVLQSLLRNVVKKTFNAITVDGDTSTNDMCLVLANGLAGNKRIKSVNEKGAKQLEEALHYVCATLAKEIARDGEGATKLVEVEIKNVAHPEKVAKTIANSPLVKTALFGNDPNWGRIIAAAGRSGVPFDPKKVEISLAGTKVYKNGAPTKFDAIALSKKMNSGEVKISVDFHQSKGSSVVVWTCDFSYGYVKINADYHT